MPLDDIDDISGGSRFFSWFFRGLLFELILEMFFWQYICGSVGWVTLRVVTGGRVPDATYTKTVRAHEDETDGMMASMTGLGVLVVVAALGYFLLR